MHSQRPHFTLVLTLCVILGLTLPLHAQTPSATLYGAVRDQTGAVIGAATIELSDEENGLKRSVESNGEGQFVLSLLSTGTYTLRVARPGFKTEVITGIAIEVGQKSKVDVLLVPGSVEEHVELIADINTLQPANSTIGGVLDNRLVESVPLNERNFLQLALLAPGVAPNAPGSDLSNQGIEAVNVGGARESSNNFLLDGVDNNDLFLNRYVVNPSIDSIQEFSVLQNNYDAQYGRSVGGQILIATKSGGRNYHGSAYEFFRHSGLDAKNYFDLPDENTPHLRRNLFGGTVGGPFVGSRNFFFLNTEFERAQQAETRTTNVPTALERQGDFSKSGVVIVNPFTGSPFSGNKITSPDPIGLKLAALYPSPNRNVLNQNYVSSPLNIDRIGQTTARMDFNSSETNPVFVRYSFINNDLSEPFSAGGPNLPGFGDHVLDRGQNLAIGTTHFFANALNDFRFGYNRLGRRVAPQNAINALSTLGAQGPNLSLENLGYPSITVAGQENLGDNPNLPILGDRETLHFTDSLSFVRGHHHLAIGGEARHYLSNGYSHIYSRGQIGFTGFIAGNSLAELLLGLPTFSILAQNNNYQALRTYSLDGFVQDDWKLNRSITVNLGLRYEYNSPPVDAHDTPSLFDLTTRTIRQVGQNGVSRSGIKPDYNNFGPRIGLSWDTTGTGRLLLRTGYGVFYNNEALIAASAWYYNPPLFNLNVYATGASLLQLRNPFPTGQGFSPLPAPVTADPNTRTGYAQHWNFGFQTHINQDTRIDATYAGVMGTKLAMKHNINQPVPKPGDMDANRPIPGFSDIYVVESAASSNYHSLQLQIEKRTSKGLSLLGGYTFSKSIDNTSAFIASSGDDNTPQDSRNLRLERGLSNFDVRHRMAVSATYDLPQLTSNGFFKGWQLNPVLSIQSGRPFTPRLSVDNSNTGNGSSINGHDRPNLIRSAKLSDPTPGRYFDPSAFTMPAPYTFGNAGRNVLTGPGLADLDLALVKNMPVTERGHLQFRAELFNALNHPNFQNPDSYFDRPTFGRVLSAFSSRQIQFALKTVF